MDCPDPRVPAGATSVHGAGQGSYDPPRPVLVDGAVVSRSVRGLSGAAHPRRVFLDLIGMSHRGRCWHLAQGTRTPPEGVRSRDTRPAPCSWA